MKTNLHSSSTALLGCLLLPLATRAADAGPAPTRTYVSPAPYFTTIAGRGSAGSANGSGIAAAFTNPQGIAVSPLGTLYVADSENHTIRRVSVTGEVTTLAGIANDRGQTDGTASVAQFDTPHGIVVDPTGYLWVTDHWNHTIRQVSPTGAVTTFAGSPARLGSNDGMVTSARFRHPAGIARDSMGNLYIADSGNSRVRKITPAGIVSTIADLAALHKGLNANNPAAVVGTPYGIAVDAAGNVFFTEADNNVIRKVTPNGVVSTLAGLAGEPGSSDGTGSAARFHSPLGLAIDSSGNLFVADHVNRLVRRVTSAGVVTTVAGVALAQGRTDGAGPDARFLSPVGIAVDGLGSIAVADIFAHQIRRGVYPPTFTTHPTGELNIRAGQNLTLAGQSPNTPVAYQWRKDGVAIPNATFSSLILSNAQPSDAGTYELAATNAAGTTLSRPARVEVFQPVVITRQPRPERMLEGDAVQFSVTATPASGLTYAWSKNGTVIPGATTATLLLTSVTAADSGDYQVRVSNPVSFTDSVRANLEVRPFPQPPPAIAAQPSSQTAIVGNGVQLSVTTTGSGPFTFQWRKDGAVIPGATGAMLTLASVQAVDAGSYSVTITNSAGSVTSTAAVLTVAPSSRLANLSIRASLATGQTVIVGLASSGAHDVLVRAVGPGLAQFGLATAMADPRLDLFSGQDLVFGNDNWGLELAPTFASVGAFALPARSQDAAVRQKVGGPISVQARGTGAGVVLLEAYELGDDPLSRLVNVSARNRVGSGDDILIAGFNLVGTGTKRLLVRAVGPGLAAFGVTGTLADPVLELFAGTNRIAGNDNWSAALAAEFVSVGAFALPPGSRDAALVVTLPPGTYTAQVRGTDGLAGEALVEIYELP